MPLQQEQEEEEVATKTIYNINGHQLRIPDSGLLNSDPENQMVTYEVRPSFNYLAWKFNANYTDERDMPTPYSEILQNNTLEEAYSVEGFNVINGGNIDAGKEDSIDGAAGPRQVFLGGVGEISSRATDFLPNFDNIILTNKSQTSLANSLAHYFPQHIEITVSGAPIKNSKIALKCLSETGGFYNLIADFVINRQKVIPLHHRLQSHRIDGDELPTWKFWSSDVNDTTILGDQSQWVHDDALKYINPVDNEEMFPDDRLELFEQIKAATMSVSGVLHPTLQVYKNEFLFYKIEKYHNNILIQTFWTANLSTIGSKISIVDTQVMVEETYTYKCFGFYLSFKSSDSLQEARLFQVPMFEQSCKIEQPSLPRSQVSFSNIKNSKDKIKIMLNLSSNPENGEFYGLNSSEKEEFDTRHANYDITKEKDKFVYETDKGRYQIYKMTEQPQMGETNDPYTNIIENSTLHTVEGDFGGTAAHFIDKVRPFKKYYYVFRNVNHYGHFSNPSPIWEVELTQDANETFLNSKVVGFAKPNMDKFLLSKTMMRMFQVIPSPAQTTFDPNSALTTDDNISSLQPYDSSNPLPTLGIVPEKIWTTIDSSGTTTDEGKRFKIRMVSKDTGRKIDFNLRFVLNKNYNTNGQN